MPYHVDTEQECISIQPYGNLKDGDLQAVLRSLGQDAHDGHTFARLINVTGVKTNATQPEFWRDIARNILAVLWSCRVF